MARKPKSPTPTTPGPLTKLAVVEIAIADVIPYAQNARLHSAAQVAQIAASIAEFGFNVPVLLDAKHSLVAGHGRILAAQQLGYTEVPAIFLGHLTPTQAKAYRLADNQIALNSTWDPSVLSEELQALNAEDFDVGLLGFDDESLVGMLGAGSDDEESDEDAIPAIAPAPVTRLGDVWTLGSHRLMCGDSTDATQIATLMEGHPAGLCFTSPPYGNQRHYSTGGISDWDALMQGVFSAAPVADTAQVLVNLGMIHRESEWHPYWEGWIAWMRAQGWRRFGWYVWDRGPGLPGDWNGRLAPSHEFVFHFNKVAERARKTKKKAIMHFANTSSFLGLAT
jgi:hypothetical protein